MKVSKKNQEQYSLFFKMKDANSIVDLYLETEEKFCPLYCISKGFLTVFQMNCLTKKFLDQTVECWNYEYKVNNKTFFKFIFEKVSHDMLLKIFECSVKYLPEEDILFSITAPKAGESVYRKILLNNRSNYISKEKFISLGINYFHVCLLNSNIPLEEMIENYKSGYEFLNTFNDKKIYEEKVSFEKIQWLVKNTEMQKDELLSFVGVDISKVNRFYKMNHEFKISDKTLKSEIGVKSQLLMDKILSKIIYENSVDRKKYYSLSILNAVKRIKEKIQDVDENSLTNALDKTPTALINDTYHDSLFTLINLLPYQSKERKLRLILTCNASYSIIADTINMISSKEKSAKELNIGLFPKKPKSIMEIHDYLMKIPDFIVNNREFKPSYAEKLDNLEVDGILFSYPKNEIELVKLGIDMSNCVGSEHYRELAVEGLSDIFTLSENGKVFACVEISNSYLSKDLVVIEQVSGFQNAKIDRKYDQIIVKAFKDKYPKKHVSLYFREAENVQYYGGIND